MTISVITPIYKAESYIERCVRSLMEQTLKDGIEFIFIDDCSPDNSMTILNRTICDYPERRSQIHIIHHTTNLGVTQSRRDGLAAATNEYIGWCDADDWVESNMFECLLDSTNNGTSDIVVCNYEEDLPNGKNIIIKHGKHNSPKECIRSCYKTRFPGSLFNQIFRRRIITKAFKEIIPTNYSEDTFAIWHVYYWSESISFVDAPLYHYNKTNINSLVHNVKFTNQSWMEQEKNLQKVTELYYSNNGKKSFHIAINFFKFYRKYFFISAFESSKEFFFTFRDSSWDILEFPNMSFMNKIKTFLVNNIYFIFFLLYRKAFIK